MTSAERTMRSLTSCEKVAARWERRREEVRWSRGVRKGWSGVSRWVSRGAEGG
jgi:hypothetical protein